MSIGRTLLLSVAFAVMVGCGNASLNDGTPIDRFVAGEDAAETFAPDSPEGEELLSMAANPSVDASGDSASARPPPPPPGRSCSSGNGTQDCYCTAGCCRNETSCWCC